MFAGDAKVRAPLHANSFASASYSQRVTHFTEELSFLSESDKDWVMGRAILTRLKWA